MLLQQDLNFQWSIDIHSLEQDLFFDFSVISIFNGVSGGRETSLKLDVQLKKDGSK